MCLHMGLCMHTGKPHTYVHPNTHALPWLAVCMHTGTHTKTHTHTHTHTRACTHACTQAPTHVCTTTYNTCAGAPRHPCFDEEEADAVGGGRGGCGAAAWVGGAALLLLAAPEVLGSGTGIGMRTRRVSHWAPNRATSSTCSVMSKGRTSVNSASACTQRASDTKQHIRQPHMRVVTQKKKQQHERRGTIALPHSDYMDWEGGGLIPCGVVLY